MLTSSRQDEGSVQDAGRVLWNRVAGASGLLTPDGGQYLVAVANTQTREPLCIDVSAEHALPACQLKTSGRANVPMTTDLGVYMHRCG